MLLISIWIIAYIGKVLTIQFSNAKNLSYITSVGGVITGLLLSYLVPLFKFDWSDSTSKYLYQTILAFIIMFAFDGLIIDKKDQYRGFYMLVGIIYSFGTVVLYIANKIVIA